ncbi:MAG TPA: DUF2752 domain-containing protein [Kofleriaceae bacterium]|nr:DUF2752 domain-containing protein [Kofleriaceae bacterium]
MKLPGRAIDLGLAAFVAAVLGASLALRPAGDQVAWPGGGALGLVCPFRRLFDLDCPFCGLTRSFVALAHGDVAAALRFHPAGPALFAALAVALVALVWVGARRARPLVERRGFILAFEAVTALSLVLGAFKMALTW